MYKVVLLFLLLLSITVFSQETIVLKGKVLNDTIEKVSLNVVNISFKKGTITNEAGVFEIPVRISDTIYISALQYDSKQFVVTQKIYDQKKVSLYLVPKINELDVVQLSNRMLSKNLEEAANNSALKENLEVIKAVAEKGLLPDLLRKTKEERRLYTATTGVHGKGGVGITGFVVPLPLLINSINGKTKRLKKHVAVSEYQEKIHQTLNRYPDSILVAYLKILEDQLEDFIFFLYSKSIKYLALREKEVSIKKKKE